MSEPKLSPNSNIRVSMFLEDGEEYLIDGRVDLSDTKDVEVITVRRCTDKGKYYRVKDDPFDSDTWRKIEESLIESYLTDKEFAEFNEEPDWLDSDSDPGYAGSLEWSDNE